MRFFHPIAYIFTPGGGRRDSIRKLMRISLIFAVFSVLFFPLYVMVTSGDYVNIAYLLSGHRLDSTEDFLWNMTYGNTPGYPILLIASGLTIFNSFKGIILIQFAMSVAIPLMLYRIALLIDEKTAYHASLISIISFVPFMYVKFINPAQSYMFLTILSACIAASYHATKKTGLLYLNALVLSALLMMQPNANPLLLVFLFFGIASAPKKAVHVALSGLIVVGFLAGWSLLRPGILDIKSSPWKTTSTTGKALFFNAYLASNGEIRPENGPATRRLMSVVRGFSSAVPDLSEDAEVGFDDSGKDFYF
ncbi:MAG TPA: hypothetical protein PLQ76_05845, partial [bacterium]|nr:hypothetical protein [bacterium]